MKMHAEHNLFSGGDCFIGLVGYFITNVIIIIIKVKLSLYQAVEAHRVVRRRGSHIF
jgi:hypothetical protein